MELIVAILIVIVVGTPFLMLWAIATDEQDYITSIDWITSATYNGEEYYQPINIIGGAGGAIGGAGMGGNGGGGYDTSDYHHLSVDYSNSFTIKEDGKPTKKYLTEDELEF